ncbi:MAG: alpha/beta hydrolase [bacterium]|nr:alpha/beta hydrolase [bacterium]
MVVKAIRKRPWFAYFPEDYRWSFNISIALSMAVTGGTDPGEIFQAARRLEKKVGDDGLWVREWTRLGDRVQKEAASAERKGQHLSAAGHYVRAAVYLQMADRFAFPKNKEALDLYRRSIGCFHKYVQLNDGPRTEIVDIPLEGKKKMAAYFVHAQTTRKKRPPVVVMYNGFDGTKEMSYVMAAEALSRRGMSALIMDSPGIGESIRFRGIHLRHDYEVAGGAALDWLEKRKDVNAGRAGVFAPSLGGYYTSRTASMEPRFKACCAWGAIWDYHATWKRRIEAAFHSQLPVPGDHLTWSFGVKTLDEALERLEGFRLDGIVQRMRCPFLLAHGEDDQQISLKEAKALYRAVGAKDKTLKVFNGEDGGAQHCHMDYVSTPLAYMADWLAEKLGA